jgi:pilus assembly protein CpaB
MRRRLVTIVLALILGLIGALSVIWYVQGADRRAVAGKQAAEALVAIRTIPAGTSGTAIAAGGYVKSEPFPVAAIPPDAITSVSQLSGDSVLRDSLASGGLLRRALLGPKGSTTAFAIPDGKLAVTVQMGDPQRVAGFVQPGSKVVVFISGPLLDGKGNKKGDLSATKTLLTDIEVLSVGTPGGSDTGKLITFAVTQQEAEKLIYGAGGSSGGNTQGGLYLALEGGGGTAGLNPNSPGVTSVTLFS